jgi:uncharacterized protein (TIGR00369 family)
MPTAVIVDAIRTPGGKRNGKLKNWHAVDLASEALRAIASRNNLDPALIDDVIMGCVSQTGEQAFNVGRNAVLAAGWPESVPATTIDRQCGSSQQALHFAAQGVMSGAYDIVVAAGVEVMSRVAMGSSIGKDLGWVTGRFDPTELACNPHGIVQAGVHSVLLDAAMNFAINAALVGRDRTNATIEMTTELMRPATRDKPYALRGEVVRLTRQIAYAEASITSDEGKLVSRATGTFLVHREATSD